VPKQVDASALKREIRSAARSVFARRGVRGTGLAHVARELGMGRSSLYHYYPAKDALLSDLVVEMLREERAAFRACLGGEGPVLPRVMRLLDVNLALFDEWAEIGRMTLELQVGDAKRFRRFFRDFRSELASALAEGQRSGEVAADLDAELTAATLIGAIDGLLLQYFVEPAALSLDGLRGELRRLATRMLAA